MPNRRIKPSHIHTNIHEIDYEALWESGVRILCFDVDNTLGLMHCDEFDQKTDELLRNLIAFGFTIAFATNSTKNRDNLREQYNAILCQPQRINRFVKRPHKPQRAFYSLLQALLGSPAPRTAAMIGDKLNADVLAAERCGFVGILVNPLGSDLWIERALFFRRLENRRLRQHGIVRAS